VSVSLWISWKDRVSLSAEDGGAVIAGPGARLALNPLEPELISAFSRLAPVRFFQCWMAGSATTGLSGTVSGPSAHFAAGSSQLMHWSSVRPEMATTGSNNFPHLAQRVMRSITDTPVLAPNSELAFLFHSRAEIRLRGFSFGAPGANGSRKSGTY